MTRLRFSLQPGFPPSNSLGVQYDTEFNSSYGVPGRHREYSECTEPDAGIWLFVSPWVYGGGERLRIEQLVAGAVIVILAAIRSGNAPVPLRLVNALLGVWVFVSPWVYGYAGNTGRLINSLGVGMLVFFLSLGAEVTKTGPSPHRP